MIADSVGSTERAKLAGVGAIMNPGADPEKFAVSETAGVWSAFGCHPEYQDYPLEAAEILARADHPKVVAIGECGLDYHFSGFDKAKQERLFREHISAAREAGLPLVIHSRDADEDMERIISGELSLGAFGFVMHCFAGGARLADFAIEAGGFLSASGIITFPSAGPLREIFARVPLARILVETDAPFLAPAPHRGKPNEPAYVAIVAAKLAEIRGISPRETEDATAENFFGLFTKVPAP